jgi:hypothetical protein
VLKTNSSSSQCIISRPLSTEESEIELVMFVGWAIADLAKREWKHRNRYALLKALKRDKTTMDRGMLQQPLLAYVDNYYVMLIRYLYGT